jgi:hypothetical protein
MTFGGRHIGPVKNMLHYHCLTFPLVAIFMCFVYNKPKVKFMHRSKHTERYRKQLYYLTRKKHDCTSAECIFNWNILVTGHNLLFPAQTTVTTTANSSDSISTLQPPKMRIDKTVTLAPVFCRCEMGPLLCVQEHHSAPT